MSLPAAADGLLVRLVAGRPALLALHAAAPARYPFLLQSVASGGRNARYDILFAFPQGHLELQANGRLDANNVPDAISQDFLTQFDAWWRVEQQSQATSDLPFRGGWFLYLGYELAGQIEPRLHLPPARASLPIARAVRIPAAVIFDHQRGITSLIAEPRHAALLDEMTADLEAAGAAPDVQPRIRISSLVEDAPQRYLDAVERVRRYIVEGDVFQVNLSRAWRTALSCAADAPAVFRCLCHANPAPFAGLAQFAGAAVISSSPERLVRVADGVVETRPIAGTRPRHHETARDRAVSAELLAHPKERAEHVMLIDLERNDLGRISVPGSVVVDELMVVESHAHVHHIVSNVRGRLRAGITPGEVIRAVFPGGTITGCPKVRCMEIIAELEQEGRGPYTGSMGYVNRDGDMDLNILIRTMALDRDCLELRAGAGIVADSEPDRELEETRAKARGLLLALEGVM